MNRIDVVYIALVCFALLWGVALLRFGLPFCARFCRYVTLRCVALLALADKANSFPVKPSDDLNTSEGKGVRDGSPANQH